MIPFLNINNDFYCRADSKLLLSFEDKLYIGYTPDGYCPGRNLLSEINAYQNDTLTGYTCSIENGLVVLRTDSGHIRFTLDNDNTVVASGKGTGLVFSNGKAPGIFMGGGNVVFDAYEGAMFAISGIKLRFLVKKGTLKAASEWNFDYLCDPDPRVYILPDENGEIEFLICVSEREEFPKTREKDIDKIAAALFSEFEEYGRTLVTVPETAAGLRAAWTLWNTKQPDAELYENKKMISDIHINGRQSDGSVFLNDTLLYALALKDTKDAVKSVFSFFEHMQQDGFVPYQISNNKLQYFVELPLFGVVFASRRDITDVVCKEQYYLLKMHFTWWTENRFCDIRNLFYYQHRTETGKNRKVIFPELCPMIAPGLNAFMLLWIEAMKSIAFRLGLSDDCKYWDALYNTVNDAVKKYLFDGEKYVCIDILGNVVEGSLAGCDAPNVTERNLSAVTEVCGYEAETLLLLGNCDFTKNLAEKTLAAFEDAPVRTIREALACLLSEMIVKGRE